MYGLVQWVHVYATTAGLHDLDKLIYLQGGADQKIAICKSRIIYVNPNRNQNMQMHFCLCIHSMNNEVLSCNQLILFFFL